MITNLWSKLDLFESYLSSNTTLANIFTGWISIGKPITKLNWKTLYLSLINNNVLIDSNRKDWKNIYKRALIEFVIVTNQKDIAHVEIYENLDTLSNEICWKEINLDWFKIKTIKEENQSGILVDSWENPLLIASYLVDYIAKY